MTKNNGKIFIFKDAMGKLEDGNFVLLKGSKISNVNRTNYSKYIYKLKENYNKYVNKSGLLKADLVFSNPSAAAIFVCGYSINGNIAWIDEQSGKKLKLSLEENK